ncbi:MAG: iron ABC transporter permease [Deltaproteobacteria bacterium]|nr:iron ABC transporter permease [Deltaproteobacteria bacterium]
MLSNRVRKHLDGWRLFALAFSLCVAFPLLFILSSFADSTREIWRHVIDYLILDLLTNTVILSTGVLSITLILGVSLAWLTAVCDFPGRRVFSWALLFPFAMPTYVLAFVMIGLYDFSGPVQTFLRALFPHHNHWFPPIRSTGGIIVVMSLSLYPYVYLLSRSAFRTQGRRALEAGRSLGCSPLAAFFKVALPMARPWIAGGLSLVLMETLADFGAVSVFNFDTFTTAIYKVWFGFFSLPAAAQLSGLLLVFVFFTLYLEQWTRRKKSYIQGSRHDTEYPPMKLSGWKRIGAATYASSILLLSFLIPFGQLVIWVIGIFGQEFNAKYLGLLYRSLFFGLSAAFVICLICLVLAYTQRKHMDGFSTALIRISTLGYAFPGAVLAVGLVIGISLLDEFLTNMAANSFGLKLESMIQGTVMVVVFAYVVRFTAVGYQPVSSSIQRIHRHIDEASINMGVKGWSLIRRVHVPMLKSGLFTALVLVFVDVMKEMPMTLMTRPFGWDTLAVKIFELTSEGEWERAALPAVTLVMGGLIPVILLMKGSEK